MTDNIQRSHPSGGEGQGEGKSDGPGVDLTREPKFREAISRMQRAEAENARLRQQVAQTQANAQRFKTQNEVFYQAVSKESPDFANAALNAATAAANAAALEAENQALRAQLQQVQQQAADQDRRNKMIQDWEQLVIDGGGDPDTPAMQQAIQSLSRPAIMAELSNQLTGGGHRTAQPASGNQPSQGRPTPVILPDGGRSKSSEMEAKDRFKEYLLLAEQNRSNPRALARLSKEYADVYNRPDFWADYKKGTLRP